MKMLDRVAAAIAAERRRWTLAEIDGAWFAIRRLSPDEGSKWDLGADKGEAEAKFAPAVDDALATAAIGAMRNPSYTMLALFDSPEALCNIPGVMVPEDDPESGFRDIRNCQLGAGWDMAMDLVMSRSDGDEASN